MPVLPAAAAAAYRAAAATGSNPFAAATSPAAGGAGSFSEFLSDAVKTSVDTIKHGETMAAKGAAGKADIVDVVNAVNAAEITLDTVVAVRDKVVAAYQSIINMPV
jgi:flagellar hook-basal body complex protein FliE